jgi:hypothetical protein
LNNLKCFTVLKEKYSEYFGFTEAEVEQVFKDQGLTAELETVRCWYNGYTIGHQTIYNPWSIVNCLVEKGVFRPYWVLTGDDSLIRNALLKGDGEIQEKFHRLLTEGGTVACDVTENLTYEDLMQRSHLWSLLLFAGYLTPQTLTAERTHYRSQLRIPNLEVQYLYEDIFTYWLKQKIGTNQYQALLHSLVTGDIKQFQQKLSSYLLHTMSAHDFQSESEYHTFMLGLISAVHDTHFVYSNKEYGLGRPDCLLIPKNENNPKGIVLEFKFLFLDPAAKKEIVGDIEAVKARTKQMAADAIEQIAMRGYSVAFAQHPQINEVLQVGLAFCYRCTTSASRVWEIKKNRAHAIEYGELYCDE